MGAQGVVRAMSDDRLREALEQTAAARGCNSGPQHAEARHLRERIEERCEGRLSDADRVMVEDVLRNILIEWQHFSAGGGP
jgi:hypothetical protein